MQTRGTVNCLGGKILCAIKCQEVMIIKKRHRFQRLASLELSKDALEHRTKPLGGDRIEALAHVCVARHTLDPVDGVQIALGSLLVKGEERGCFEGKHGKGGHERIG